MAHSGEGSESPKPYSSSPNRSSKAIRTLGAELGGPKAMLLLGSNPLKDKEAMLKADASLKLDLDKQRRRSSGRGFAWKSSESPLNSPQGSKGNPEMEKL